MTARTQGWRRQMDRRIVFKRYCRHFQFAPDNFQLAAFARSPGPMRASYTTGVPARPWTTGRRWSTSLRRRARTAPGFRSAPSLG